MSAHPVPVTSSSASTSKIETRSAAYPLLFVGKFIRVYRRDDPIDPDREFEELVNADELISLDSKLQIDSSPTPTGLTADPDIATVKINFIYVSNH